MYWAMHAYTVRVQWGDVATWVLAIGTSGTLITGLYIILRDRRNEYRSHIDQLSINAPLKADSGTEGKSMILVILNHSFRTFYELDLYIMATARFTDETRSLVGVYCGRGQLSLRKRVETEPMFQQIYSIIYDEFATLTFRVTDGSGRTWFKERGKPAQLVTWRNGGRVRRKLDHLEQRIRQAVGEHYCEPPWSTDKEADI